MLYTELQSAVHAMIQRLEYSFTFTPSLLTIPKRKQQVSEILAEAEKYMLDVQTYLLVLNTGIFVCSCFDSKRFKKFPKL